ncbi:PKD domain-containing protein [Yinghuangia aomiensis]
MAPDANGLPDPTKISAFASNVNPVQLKTGLRRRHLLRRPRRRPRRPPALHRQPSDRAPDRNAGERTVPLAVAFDGTASATRTPDKRSAMRDFDRNGTTDATTPTATWTYSAPGTYHPQLTVTDPTGLTGTAETTIVAGNAPPTAVIDTPAASRRGGSAIRSRSAATPPTRRTAPFRRRTCTGS